METKETQRHPKPLVNATCLLGEKGCYENGKCHYIGNCEHKVLTNADRIRAMSDDGLAKWISDMWHGFVSKPWCDFRCQNCREGEDFRCEKCALEWLKQPAEE